VKCAIWDNLVVKSTQHVVRTKAPVIIFCSCIHIDLEWDEQNHHLLKNKYFHRLPHFGMLPRMEPSSDAVIWQLNVSFVLLKLTCFHRIFVKLSFRPLLVLSNDQEKRRHRYSYPRSLLRWARKSTLKHGNAQKNVYSWIAVIYTTRPSTLYYLC
jgi:hypothetical protein